MDSCPDTDIDAIILSPHEESNLRPSCQERGTKKKNISFNFFTELKTYHLSIFIYKHEAIDIADPSSMQDMCHMYFVIDLAHRGVSKKISDRTSEREIRRSDGDSEFFLCPTLVTRRKNIFLDFFTELKTYHLLYFYLFLHSFTMALTRRICKTCHQNCGNKLKSVVREAS